MALGNVLAEISSLTRTGNITAEDVARVSATVGKNQDRDELRAVKVLMNVIDNGVVTATPEAAAAVRAQIARGDEVERAVEKNRTTPGTKVYALEHSGNRHKALGFAALLTPYAAPLAATFIGPFMPLGAVLALMGAAGVVGWIGGSAGDKLLDQAQAASREFAASLPD